MNFDALPDFALAPWELPPWLTSEPLVAPATMCWHGELFGREGDWLVRMVVDGHLARPFVCAENRPHEAKWVSAALMPLKGIETQDDLTAAINNHIQLWGRYLCRTFYLVDEAAEWTLIVDASGLTRLRSEEGMPTVEMNWPFDVVHATSEQLYAEFLRQWNDPDTDLNFARRWLLLSQDEQYDLMIRWGCGGEGEFLGLMRLVLLAFWPHVSARPLCWRFHPIRRLFTLSDWDGSDWYDLALSNAEEPFASDWGQALLDIHAPQWNEALAKTHICTTEFGNRLAAVVSTATHHEQLEAARELSEWLDERESRNELSAPLLAQLRATLC